jgi:glucose dehydrogenase
MYRHDVRGSGYSSLAQITTTNVATLTRAWTYRLQPNAAQALGSKPARSVNSQATPTVVGGVMYLTAGNRIVALEPEAGREMWQHAVAGSPPSRRGVAYWPGERNTPARIIFAAGHRLMAVDAETGTAVSGFGQGGEVDMVVPYNSVPLVHHNTVIVGANTPPGARGGVGNPRAYDARNGEKLWEFSAVAQPGQPGHDTWEGDDWKGRLGANAWPFYFTLDERTGLVFIPLASPIGDYYGGDRKGANLYGNSVVAVDALTGQYRWHYQTIHHDLWDHDPPAPPGLFDVTQDGRTVPALALTTKSGFMYFLNRETGRPLFGVVERTVPPSDAPGEAAFPTQPFPVKPPALARNSFQDEDLVRAEDTTPEHAQACANHIGALGGVVNLGPFTPWRYRAPGAPPPATLTFPGMLGGVNWGGTAFDPDSGYVFAVS